MLDGYGLHQLTWDTCDERFGDVLVASAADAQGRGISLAVRQNGAAANLTGAMVYLVWRHKVTGERGTEPFTTVNAAGGTFSVYYPAAMQEAEGAVQAQVMVSRGDDTYISSRVFTIRVEPVIVGGEEHDSTLTSMRTAKGCSRRLLRQMRTGSCWRAGGYAQSASTWDSGSPPGTAIPGRTATTSRASRSHPIWRITRSFDWTTCCTRARRRFRYPG